MKRGNGAAVYRFDQRDYAMEIVAELLRNGEAFTTNFDYETE